MVDAQTVSIVFAGLSIGIAAIYYALTIRNAQRNQELTLKAQEEALRTRQAQLFMQVYDKTNSPQFVEAYSRFVSSSEQLLTIDDFIKWRSDPENLRMQYTMSTFFEGVGVLVKEKLIEIRLVALLMTGPIMQYWGFVEPVIREYREREGFPRAFVETEYLYNQLMDYIKEHPEIET